MKLNTKTILKGFGLYAVTAGSVYYYAKQKEKEFAAIQHNNNNNDNNDNNDNTETTTHSEKTYERIASEYDNAIGKEEFFAGIPIFRRFLIGHAIGSCLETSAGTGRNLKYYKPNAITSLMMSDQSEKMLQIAEKKSKEIMKVSPSIVNYKIVDNEKLPFDNDTFDTVVDTFGLCSCSNPVHVLNEIHRVVKPGGKILLLQHGRSWYQWLFDMMDKSVERHKLKWGCDFNRDIEEIINQSNIKNVEYFGRFHLGTTYYIIAKK